MLMQIKIEGLGIGQYGAYLLIERRVLRERSCARQAPNQDRKIYKFRSVCTADSTHGCPLLGLDRLPLPWQSNHNCFLQSNSYSLRSASIGSTAAARRAGIKAASVPTNSSRATTLK